ncbi:methylmalonyl-CoA mutase family protein [Lutibacter sp. TH_r2]|uniref:methylmalonyl-CoA mutase family protein n=1 Tax=Lutibacter sp. TH_r2 TaxID=3082083 RepID=UPI002953644D|nr:methylmalonyl-CoA mutase family protein [Lutibacter sp. TH_r2]MDV7185822.1 methylmalonyl-CoA mutase family protein [Lutibacter sp. TH_r2]
MSNFFTDDFQKFSAAAWKQKIQFELNGADYNKTLLTNTSEGITIKPFYHIDEFEKLKIPTTTENYKVCQKIHITLENEANKKAINAINKGTTSLKFICKQKFNIENLFKNLLGKKIEFHFQLEFLSKDFILKLASYLTNEIVYYNIDIIGNLAKTGNWFTTLNNDFENVEKLLATKNLISVNTTIYQNAGANTVQQIAYALAHANEYFTRFGGEIANNIQFNFSIGNNFFFEIAKIRTFRYLYQLLLSEYNISCDAKVFVEPSKISQTNSILNSNEFIISTELISSILSGADTVTNTENNSKLLQDLINKNNLQKIPTGSYYIESITKQLAEKALIIFKDIEKGGGFLKQLKEGIIQRKIKENSIKENLIPLTNKNKVTRKTLIIPITSKRLKNEA